MKLGLPSRDLVLFSSSQTENSPASQSGLKSAGFVLLFFLLICPQILRANTIYVDVSAGCPGTGTSWGTAFCDLQSALAVAVAGDSIWIADGTYYPTTGTDQTLSFNLITGVSLYGGFAGGETLFSQRDFTINIANLSGDIGVQGSSIDNSYHVLFDSGVDSTTVVDGITIRDGNASGSGVDAFGGGMYTSSGQPIFRNVIFTDNEAERGAGIYSFNSNITLDTVVISKCNTTVSGSGGGIFINRGAPVIHHCMFKQNDCGNPGGGAIFTVSGATPDFFDCIFLQNTSLRLAGAIQIKGSSGDFDFISCSFFGNQSRRSGGAVRVEAGVNVGFENCVFSGNVSGWDGGAIEYLSTTTQITHCTFWGNECGASFTGGAIIHDAGTLTLNNNIFWGNTIAGNDVGVITEIDGAGTRVISNTILQDGSGPTIYSFDPGFVNDDGPDDVPGTLDDNLRIGACSPAVDTGATTPVLVDRDGNIRPFDGNQDGNAKPDPGAYESQIPGVAPTITFTNSTYNCGVNVTCNGANDGSSSISDLFVSILWSTGDSVNSINNLIAGSYSVTVTDTQGCSNTDTTILAEPVVLNIDSISVSVYNCGFNVSCNGGNNGTAQAFVSGGCAPYSYSWSSGDTSSTATGLSAITYSVTVTDANGCSISDSLTLTEPLPLLSQGINPLVQGCGFNISCNGGSDGIATSTVAGGCGPYQFLWSNGDTTATATGLPAGLHSVTLTDANGCSTSDTITLTQPTPVEVSNFTISTYNCGFNITCNGATDGSINAIPGGGCAPYAYAWNTGDTVANLNNLPAGTYSLTLTDFNNCTVSDSVTLTQPAPLVSQGIVADTTGCGANISCNGGADGNATVTVTGGCTPYSYLWTGGDTSQAATGLTAGLKVVSLTDANGCALQDSITLVEPPSLLMDSLVSPELSPGANVTCSGATDGSATAYPSGGCPPYQYLWSNGDTGPTADSLTNGPSWVTVTDANGCTRTDTIVLVDPVTIIIDSVIVDQYQCGFNVSCFGSSDGSATVYATGGSPPYSYNWSSGGSLQMETGIPAGSLTVSVTDTIGCTVNTSVTLTEPTPLEADSFALSNFPCGYNVDCNGASSGSAQVIPSGGCAPYQYLWNGGQTTQLVTGLNAGLKTVTITDTNGCTVTDTVILTEPNPLQIDSLNPSVFNCGNNVSCNGGTNGSVVASVSGGCSPYDYSWSNGDTLALADGLAAGQVSLTLSDINGCVTVDSITLTEPPALRVDSITAGTYNCGFNISCNGNSDGSATLFPGGGCPPYSYLWDNGNSSNSTSGLTARTVTVVLSDNNGCVLPDSITLTEPAELSISFLLSNYSCGYNVSCNGATDGSITTVVSGGCAPYTYLWTPNGSTDTLNNLGAGAYSVVVIDANNCLAFADTFLTEPPAMSLDSITVAVFGCNANVSCYNGMDGTASAFASGGCGPYSYLWTDGQITSSATNLTAGMIGVIVSDSNGCSVTDSVTLSEPLELEIDSLTPVVYACGTNVSCSGFADGSVTVSASGGCPPYQYLWSNADTSATATSLPAGIVTVTLTDANGCTVSDTIQLNEPTPLTTAVLTDSVSCNGLSDGALDITVTGGANCGAYSYSWTGPAAFSATTEDISGLITGNYIVTVTDTHNCPLTDTLLVPEPAVLSITDSIFAETCTGREDGTLEIFPAGGTSPYQVLWSTGDTVNQLQNLPGGAYSFLLTDTNNCTLEDTLEVPSSQFATNLITPVGLNIVCLNDTLQLIAPPGFVSYQWSTGDTTQLTEVYAGGDFTLIATDSSGCQQVDTHAVAFNNAVDPSPSVTPAGNPMYCDGDTLFLDAGAGYFSYEWNTGFTGQVLAVTQPGPYFVLVFNGFGCGDFSDTIFADTFTVIRPSFVRIGDTLFASPGSNFQWYHNGNPIVDATQNVLLVQRTGDYHLCGLDTNGCYGCSDTVSYFVGISPALLKESVRIYPNPVSDLLYLEPNQSFKAPVSLRLTDLYGREISTWKWPAWHGRRELSVEGFANGIYFLEISVNGGKAVWKVMVE